MAGRSSKLLFIAVCLGALVTGCGPEGGRLALSLTVAGQALSLGPRGEPPPDIGAFRLCVQDREGADLACQDFSDLLAGSYRLGGIPAGSGRAVTFQGYSVDADTGAIRVLWCGRAADVTIRDDEVTPVSMLLSRCSDFTDTPAPPLRARAFHTATLLPNGTLLVSGGYVSVADDVDCGTACVALAATAEAEIYNPSLGAFTAVPGGLIHPRGFHVAAALPDGRVLLAGGCEVLSIRSTFSDPDQPGSPLGCHVPGSASRSAEVFDPQSGTSEAVAMPSAVFAGGVALPGGQLLVAGGEDPDGIASRQVVLVDASVGSPEVQVLVDILEVPRRSALALLTSPTGEEPAEVLLVGGAPAVAEDDPGLFAEKLVAGPSHLFSVLPGFVENHAGDGLPLMHAAGTWTTPGRVVVTGGVYPGRFGPRAKETPFMPVPVTTTALLDLRTDSLLMLDNTHRLATARACHSATRMDRRGHALVAGGFTGLSADAAFGFEVTDGAEWWDDDEEGFSLLWLQGQPVRMRSPRAGHTATRLADGTVVLLGGLGTASVQATAEIFNPVSKSLGPGGPVAP